VKSDASDLASIDISTLDDSWDSFTSAVDDGFFRSELLHEGIDRLR